MSGRRIFSILPEDNIGEDQNSHFVSNYFQVFHLKNTYNKYVTLSRSVATHAPSRSAVRVSCWSEP